MKPGFAGAKPSKRLPSKYTLQIERTMIRMKIKTRVLPADEAGVAEAAQLLRQGQLVALPTATVYGIAADARNGAAVSDIFVA